MDYAFFQATFRENPQPIIICEYDYINTVIYANHGAKVAFNQRVNICRGNVEQGLVKLGDFFSFVDSRALFPLLQSIRTQGRAQDFLAQVCPIEGDPLTVSISGNHIDIEGRAYCALYFNLLRHEGSADEMDDAAANAMMSLVLREAYQSIDPEQAINSILGTIGDYVNVSRVYIFEDFGNDYTGNTYEWCNQGVEPQIDNLGQLRKDDYNYEEIVNSGMYVYDDIDEIDNIGRDILVAQNIKAIALLTLYKGERALGYVGFDDCEKRRRWSSNELQLLEQVSNIIVSLLDRRNALRATERSLEVLKTVTDNYDAIIYISDVQTNEVFFANRRLAEIAGVAVEKVIGGLCWEVLQSNSERCEFCPLPRMIAPDGTVLLREYVWQFLNPKLNKWFMIRDSIIKWIDGRDVHLETAIDITTQKDYEQQLRRFASIDAMTGVYNREWGYKTMRDLMAELEINQHAVPTSICFIDIDNLKYTNDTYGHEAGDEMIITAVNTVRAIIRESDVICRWGGDEFVVLLRCDTEKAEDLLARVNRRLDAYNQAQTKPYELTISYGIVAMERGATTTIDQYISQADAKMYVQKMTKPAKGVNGGGRANL